MRIMKSFLTGTKELSQFAATRTDRRQGGRGELVDLTGQSDGSREEENYYNLS